MQWLDVEGAAQQAVGPNWDGKKLPSGIRSKIKLAAGAAALRDATETDLAEARSTRLLRAGGLAVLLAGAAVSGVIQLFVDTPADEVGSSIVAVILLVLVSVWAIRSSWREEPLVSFQRYERRRMVKAGKAEVHARARELQAATYRAARAPITVGVTYGVSDGITPRQAEELAARIMTRMGARNVLVTPPVADGGLDVAADGYVAEVKHHRDPVPEGYVQRILGVARDRGARAIFFARSGYRPAAVQFAERNGVLLFTYDHTTETVVANSTAAQSAITHGL